MSARRQAVAMTLAMTLWMLVTVSVAPPLQGQGTDRSARISPSGTVDTAKFLARARAGTSRYREQDVAVADGYKPVGVEFPAMGTHWVHLGHVLEDSLIPERPSVLIYVKVGDRQQLAGVAYTDLRAGGEPAPTVLAPGGWHEHNGTVADESFPLSHDASGHASDMLTDPEMRLSVLHAWIWIPNPAGAFVTDNWSLPPLRVGVVVPDDTPRDALRTLALATDEDRYLLLTLRTGLDLSVAEEAAALAALTEQRSLAMKEVDDARRAKRVTPDASARLVARWAATWTALERALPRRRAQLRALRQRLG